MFWIRRIHDPGMPGNRVAIAAVQKILREQFPNTLKEEEVAELPAHLADPRTFRLRTVLVVAEGNRTGVRGFAFSKRRDVDTRAVVAGRLESRLCHIGRSLLRLHIHTEVLAGGLLPVCREVWLAVVGPPLQVAPQDELSARAG